MYTGSCTEVITWRIKFISYLRILVLEISFPRNRTALDSEFRVQLMLKFMGIFNNIRGQKFSVIIFIYAWTMYVCMSLLEWQHICSYKPSSRWYHVMLCAGSFTQKTFVYEVSQMLPVCLHNTHTHMFTLWTLAQAVWSCVFFIITFDVHSYYKVKLTLESENKQHVDEAQKFLMDNLPNGKVFVSVLGH